MSKQIQQDFNVFLASHPPVPKQITPKHLCRIFQDQLLVDYDQGSILTQQFFKSTLRKCSQLIINIVYNRHLAFIKIQPIVPFVCVLQYLTHEPTIGLPLSLLKQINKYSLLLLTMQNIDTMRNTVEQAHNSTSVHHFYHSIYKNAVSFRMRQLAFLYGLNVPNSQLVQYLLQCVSEQKEGAIQTYDIKVTSEWIILSLVYFVLSAKADLYKQKPILSKIYLKYKQLSHIQIQRQLNCDQLCHFYNNIALPMLQKLNQKQIQKLVDQVKTDIDVMNQFIVTPIQSQNNTILDNIIFSSSWEG